MRSALLALVSVGWLGCSGGAAPDAGEGGGLAATGGGTASAGGGSSASGGGTSAAGGSAATGGGSSAGGGGSQATGGGTNANGGGTPATGGGSSSPDGGTKSSKRGVAYDIASANDLAVLSPGVGWWYDWGTTPSTPPASGVDFYPMLWNGSFNSAAVGAYLRAHPELHFILVMNEPNLTSQSNLTPQAAAALWPQYEALAADAGVGIVGPQITWGTMPNYTDPVVWLDAFYDAYHSANGNRDPQIACTSRSPLVSTTASTPSSIA